MSKNAIYQIKVSLRNSKPPIWRRIQVPGNTRLDELHLIIQTVMGWGNYHLHQFIVGETYFGLPHPDDWYEVNDERDYTLSRLSDREGFKFTYEYDFGDNWQHDLLVEKILPLEPGGTYPRCIKGKRACPPEDVGGVWGYDDFLAAIKDPHHDEHQATLDWVGGEFDPEAFDLDKINAALQQLSRTPPLTETHPDYPDPVAKLLTLGDVRGKLQWLDYLALGLTADHVPDLVRMALDDELHWADSDSDEVWAPLHAWRALGQLQAGAAVEPLLTLLSRVDEFNDDWVGEDLPEVFGHIGQPTIAPLARYLANSNHGLWARVAAASSFAEIGQRHPDQRDACVEALTQQLTKFEELDPILNGSIITELTDLKAVESAAVMEQAFAAGQVDISIQGDWEDTQIRLGLLQGRLTPKPNYHPLLDRFLEPLLDKSSPPAQTRAQPDEPKPKAGIKTKLKAQSKAKAKARAKRKQQKKTRKKQRKR